jgi:hypothetical protein
MKRIIAVLALGLCVGCGTQKESTTTANPPPPPAGSNLLGTWKGTVTGTNFTGSADFLLNVCYPGPTGGAECISSGQAVVIAQILINLDCDNNSVGNQTTIPLIVSGNQFSATYVGEDNSKEPVTIEISGTENSATNGISGTMTFSDPPCGSAASPWAATFSATLSQ